MPGDQPVYPVLRQLTSKPPIVTQIDGLLTPAECAYLVQAASDAGFEASKTEGRGEDRSVRTSRTAHLPENDEVVACVGRRLATVAGKSAPRSAAKLHAGDEPRAAASNDLCPRAALQKSTTTFPATVVAEVTSADSRPSSHIYKRTESCPQGSVAVLLASTVCAEAMGRAYACTRALVAQSCGITTMTSAGETRALSTVEQK